MGCSSRQGQPRKTRPLRVKVSLGLKFVQSPQEINTGWLKIFMWNLSRYETHMTPGPFLDSWDFDTFLSAPCYQPC